ncbi:general odorant-binding protein 56h-like [Stomoxys calcitrans]|uniref:general odorant-binding protein 56h-like n=1 Tax=Stomoxys calcitrans TaxID=35570 RepID=UPI0027E24219|nr:general odorant-binding protein 56h-like [Stomoxys calcitrans]
MRMNFLFYVISLFLVLHSTRAHDFLDTIQDLIEICQKEVPQSEQDLQNFIKSNMDLAKATNAVKCHSKCILEKQGLFPKGVFDEKAFLNLTLNSSDLKDYHAEVVKAIDECKKEKGADDCETAFKINMCLRSKSDEVMGH